MCMLRVRVDYMLLWLIYAMSAPYGPAMHIAAKVVCGPVLEQKCITVPPPYAPLLAMRLLLVYDRFP
jgi:hypothetical protein